jgi:hypothetical protein
MAPGRSRHNAPPIQAGGPKRSRRSRNWQEEKWRYLEDFRFTIAGENTSYPGYTSEKLVDAMMAGCIPIYWGNPEVSRDFNTQSFVDVGTYERKEASRIPAWLSSRPGLYERIWRHWIMPRAVERAVRRVMEIDDDEDLYHQMLAEPWFENNEPNEYFDYERFQSRMMEIARTAVARRAARCTAGSPEP